MKTKKFFDRRTVFVLAIWAIVHVFSFYITDLLTISSVHYSVETPADAYIPFVPVFILPYVLAYFQWAAGVALVCGQERSLCFKLFSVEFIAKLISAAVFLVMPTVMLRPEVQNAGICEYLTRLIYSLDTPTNLFPSFHCLESWFCLRTAFLIKPFKNIKAYRVFTVIFSIIVFASTVLVKQHEVLDIAGGIAVVEIGFLLSRVLHADRPLELLYRKTMKGCADEE